MYAESVARAEKNVNVRELRLGLVCYGGVSLAIYMHGITKEVHKLVIASRAFECDPTAAQNPFPAACTEHAYWDALKAAYEQPWDKTGEKVVTRVVVDVIAGTSAGGINGVFLSKALAHNRSQNALRNLWFERADKDELLGAKGLRQLAKIARFAFDLVRRKAEPPLDGSAMLGWLFDALQDMDRVPSPAPDAGGSLVPDGHSLQLFVTTTDYHGYRQELTISDPGTVPERRHRHVYEFAYERGGSARDQLGSRHNTLLAFAARSTSSFPGAFPPLRIAELGERFQVSEPVIQSLHEEFFRSYTLSGADARNTYFVDGGVLNNYPFKPAIDAIFKLRAESEVDRYLLYLQPDPGEAPQNPKGEKPTFFGAAWAALSGIAASQPIVDNILQVRRFNEQVREVNELIDASKPRIAGILQGILDRNRQTLGDRLVDATQEQLAAQRTEIDQEAARQAGFLYQPYFQLRVHSIVDQFAESLCEICGYEVADNNFAYVVRAIIDRWAVGQRLIGENPKQDLQEDLLLRFDLGYTRRRFAFVLQGVNDFYRSDDRPSRQDLNLAKAALYDAIDDLRGLMHPGALSADVTAPLKSLFAQEKLSAAFSGQRPLAEFVAQFVADHAQDLERVRQKLGDLLWERKKEIHLRLYKAFQRITEKWTAGQRQEIVVRYLGFPFWDAMIYPLIRLSEAGELRPVDIVRMSPSDSTRLGRSSAREKLKGVALGHFAAFLDRESRESDYLWGRLDGAERLIGLVLKGSGPNARPGFQARDHEVKPVLEAVFAEERKDNAFTKIGTLVSELEARAAKLPDPPP